MWAALFPGQGSQRIGMGKFLYDNFKIAKRGFEEASDALSLDFKKLCFTGSEEELALTHNTQPALLLTSVVSYRVFKELTDFAPCAGAGHSVGEYAALVCAGSLKFTEGLNAVRQRGQFMQSAVPVGQGGMLAVIGLTPEQTQKLCDWAEEKTGLTPLEPANFNAPGQIVVSGSAKLTQWLNENVDKTIFDPAPKRLRLIPLKVSAPFHCSMMKPAEENMGPVLQGIDFKPAQFPVIQNYVAQPVTDADQLRSNLLVKISAPVRWVECVEQLRELGAKQLIEFGCGTVISGLVKKIDSENLTPFNMNSLDELKALEDAVRG